MRHRNRIERLVFVGLLTVLAPQLVRAQGSIAGIVKDVSGAVLPGTTVEASSPALIEKTRTVVTDAGGQYRIVELRPGTYTVTFALTGFATVKREGIELSGTATATVNAELRVGGVEETITVSGQSPLVDIQNVQQQKVLTKEIIDTLPTGRTMINVGVLIPGMVLSQTFSGEAQDVGGNTGEVQQTLSIHGSRGGDMRRMVDGLSMQSQGTSVSAFAANGVMVQEVAVDTAAGSAEQSAGGVRMNIIPREGGNTFSGTMFAGATGEKLQGDNIDQELLDRGFISTSSVKNNWEFNPGFGGPIVRDRLWFFASGRASAVNNYIAGAVRNLNAGNPNSFAYAPDTSFRGSRDTLWRDINGRATWQVAQKNKVSFFLDYQDRCSCYDSRALTAPEASADFKFPAKRLVTLTYTSPVTSRVLVEAGMSHKPEDWGYFTHEGAEADERLIGVFDQASGVFYRGPRPYYMSSMRFFAELEDTNWRASVSYITGTHALKLGYQDHVGSTLGHYNIPVAANLSYTFSTGVPASLTLRAPYDSETHAHDGGVYAQDKWIIKRATINLGVRWDFYQTSFPEQSLTPTPYTPNRNVTFPASDLASFNDITPKFGLAYDLFGNGRTALKATLNKYVEQLTYTGTYGDSANPVQRTLQNVTRSWSDLTFPAGDPRRGNFIPDCDLLNQAGNGECGAGNTAFGQPIPSTRYDPEILTGWGSRGYNWEGSVSVQHQVLANVSAEVGYFRRWYGNFLATDNLAVAATDFDTFTVTAPSDPRLPADSAGQTIGGLVNVTPTKFAQTNNLLTFAKHYGSQVENWQGFDVSVIARLRRGLAFQGGISTGRSLTDSCDIRAQLPELNVGQGGAATPQAYCRIVEPYLTQAKVAGTYTVPRIDVQLAGTFQSIPGPRLVANVIYPSSVITPSLGRPLSGNAQNATVNVIAPASAYGDRLNQLDFRIGKLLRFAGVRTALNLDLFNSLNGNAVLSENPSFNAYRQPLLVLNPRIVKFSVNVDF
jgi:Carboxypeptidase regulatory-like domain